MKTSKYVLAVAMLFVVAAGTRVVTGIGKPAIAAPAKKGVDPEADKILREMTDYMAALPSFTVQSSTVDQMALKNGEKIQTLSDSDISIERPNKLRSQQRGAGERLAFIYDGKTMTILCKANNTYETTAAPETIDETIDKMRKVFHIDAPGADLLYSKPYDILMEQVVSGRVIGKTSVSGKAANHLAYKGEDVDWQIWIQDGGEPLPLRFVITSKKVKGQPEFVVQLSNWVTRSKLPPSIFEFQAPTTGKPAQGVAASCGVTPDR
jgi:hypothetical protein